MTVTINDVAKEAGVSITTVSRVLNNNYPVKKETREKIENAIKKLNYKPNVMARSLITKKTSVIGVVVPGITNLFFSTVVETIEDYIKDKGYSVYLSSTGGDFVKEVSIVENMIGRRVDGIVVIDPSIENINKGFYNRDNVSVPLLVINGYTQQGNYNYVSYDEKIGTYEAFQYLLELGHEKVAFIRGDKSASYDIKEKIYKELITEKFEYNKVLNVGKANTTDVINVCENKFMDVLNSEDRPTAVFACNDIIALGVLNACRNLDISVPEELSIIGFDNTLFSIVSQPTLTTVDLHMREIGKTAGEKIIDIIENERKENINLVLSTSLVKRESCNAI